MKDTILKRVENLESLSSVTDRLAELSHDEKQNLLREYYSKRIGANHVLSKEEYEDALLAEFPPSMPCPTGNETDKEEKKAQINTYLRKTAYRIAVSRGLIH